MADNKVNYKVEAWDVVEDVRFDLGEFGDDFKKADRRFKKAIKERKEYVKLLKFTIPNTQYIQLMANGIVISEARISKMKWERNVWKEADFQYIYYTLKTESAYCEIRCYGNTKTGDCDLLCERKVTEDTWKAPAEWETEIDRELFPSFKDAKRKAEEWINGIQ